jgi:acetylornithine deacetylase
MLLCSHFVFSCWSKKKYSLQVLVNSGNILHTNMTDSQNLLEQLIAIDSVNPSLVTGGAGETKIAKFVQHWLETNGFTTHWLETTPNRPSVVAIAKGTGGGRSLMLNGHLDTVTIAGYEGNALEPRIENGKMFGRGSYDMKSGVAAMLVAAARAKELGLRGDILIACVADEEDSSLGTEEVLRSFTANAGIVTEPTELEIQIAHKGFVWATITTHGVAAHGSRPYLGVDAIAKMGRVLIELEQLDLRLRSSQPHAILGTGSVHASIISGGEERSSYPAQCVLEIERRTIPSENASTLEAEIQAILETCQAADPNFKASFKIGLERHPLETPRNAKILEILKGKTNAKLSGASYWADAALMQAAGIDTVMYGVIGEGAHASTEWVDLSSLETLTDNLFETIKEFCQ